jgi:probable rRNA maturation factor
MTPSAAPPVFPEPRVDLIIQSPLWGSEEANEPWVSPVVAAALPPERSDCELAVVLTDDQSMRALNARFRGVDAPTNVLAFPAPAAPPFAAQSEEQAASLGDVVIAFETAQAEAAAAGKEFVHHTVHLLVHGVLHLLGYDHGSDTEAEAMEARERTIFIRLGLPDPYEERERA